MRCMDLAQGGPLSHFRLRSIFSPLHSFDAMARNDCSMSRAAIHSRPANFSFLNRVVD